MHQAPIRTGKLSPLDRWIIAAVIALIVGVLGYLEYGPWDGSSRAKVRLVLDEFERYQDVLGRFCAGPQLQPGVLPFERTGIPSQPLVHKRSRVRVKVSVVATEPDEVVLTVTLPEITAEGVYSLWNAEPIPAGRTIRSKGRCERGVMSWTRPESNIPG